MDLFPAVHEKIFVVFMVTSCCYMLLNTLIFKWTRTDILTPTVRLHYLYKYNKLGDHK